MREIWARLTENLSIKLLSLGLAAALWVLATGAKDAVMDVSVPVTFRNMPPGLALAGDVPARVEVTVAGSRLRFLGLRPNELSLALDLKDLGEGTATFGGIEKRLDIPAGVTVMRVYPSVLRLKLVKVSRFDEDKDARKPACGRER